ncbi:MAG: 2-oxoacid:acceptor oxidoreductase family protein [Clostridiales Family XIII bacterium]|jgi:2-oxoglutarate ferredoxin oxidoreductase subunit gamma|nr:2-oxoacid:acceptor oxidoreductase family protein [Clostridiales Family XIII bacterium]
MTQKVLMAGFGGQGVMLMGELLAYAAMLEGKQVTYMPSYGPEMRGGTANCSVVISDEEISSPIVTEPAILIAMNEPSMEKFEKSIAPSGMLFINRSLIRRTPLRQDIKCFPVECNELARAILSEKIANIVMLGAVICASGIVSGESVGEVMRRKFVGKKSKFIPMNMKALTVWSDHYEDEKRQ